MDDYVLDHSEANTVLFQLMQFYASKATEALIGGLILTDVANTDANVASAIISRQLPILDFVIKKS